MSSQGRMKLTDKSIARLRAPASGRSEVWDDDCRGFGLRILPSGLKTWQVVYRIKGSPKAWRTTLGRYCAEGEAVALSEDAPLGSSALTIAQAKARARAMLADANAGVDPQVAERQKADRMAQLQEDTFRAVRARFIQEYCIKHKLRSWQTVERYLSRDLSDWDERPVTSISKRDIIQAVERKARTAGPIAANRLLAYVSKFMRWCAAKDILQTVPVIGIERPGVETARERTLTETEIAKLWPVWQQLGWPFGPMFQILLATGQRRNQVASMRWPSIRPKQQPEIMVEGCPYTPIIWVWELESAEMKGKRGHVVPLSDLVLDILAALPRTTSGFVFPAARKGRGAGKAEGERGFATGFSKGKVASDRASGVTGWALHDLRRSCATYMAQAGIPEAIVGRVLHHAPSTVTARHYDMWSYLPQMQAALDIWAKRLGSIVGIAQPEGVVDIAEARASRALPGSA